jgi:hypothetical protein
MFTDVTGAARTSTGSAWLVAELFPTAPCMLEPQHCSAPFTTAQACWYPSAIWVTPDAITGTGTNCGMVDVALGPTVNARLRPQHCTPPFTTAHVLR